MVAHSVAHTDTDVLDKHTTDLSRQTLITT